MKKCDKKAQINFVWIFAIFAGGAILVLSIYGASQAGETATQQSSSQTAKSISILIDPLQAGYTEGTYGSITFSEETRIYNQCSTAEFGYNALSVSTQDNNGDWADSGEETKVTNKYIFSSDTNDAKTFYVLSKPFYFPYKVSDLTFMIYEDYCFVSAPDEISTELTALNIEKVKVSETLENCSASSTTVCFKSKLEDCDIYVTGADESEDSDYFSGTVAKDGYSVRYVGNLMYAAIFSDESNYLCNVERLLYRAISIAEVLSSKADLMSNRGCTSSMKTYLSGWTSSLESIEASEIYSLADTAESLEERNDGEVCNLW